MPEPRRFAEHFAFLGNLGGVIFPIGTLALLVVPGIWFYQGREWLDTGHWPAVSVADGLRWIEGAVPSLGWLRDRVTNPKFLAFPLSLVLLGLIAAPMIVYARFSQWLERRCQRPGGQEQH